MSQFSDTRYRPRKIPTQDRANFTFDTILDAAAQVLLNDGYENASTNKIAERAGVSIGSLYEYFPSKEAVFCALRLRCSEIEFNHVTTELQNARDIPIRELMRLLIKKGIEAILLHPEITCALQSEVPAHILKEKSSDLFADFLKASMEYTAQQNDQLRKQDLDMAMWVGAHVPALLIGHTLVEAPERLTSQAFADELYDLMSRYFLED